MHEMAIASALVEQLARIARENNATRITAAEVHCGILRQVVPEALELAFAAASAESPAAGAVLKIVEQPIVARCRSCQRIFEAAVDNFLCPACQTADVELLAGQDIILQTVTLETSDERTS